MKFHIATQEDLLEMKVMYLKIVDKMRTDTIEKNAEYLRLFVVDFNRPAINLYEKFGFKRVEGIYKEVIDEALSFNEFGYEIKLETNYYEHNDCK